MRRLWERKSRLLHFQTLLLLTTPKRNRNITVTFFGDDEEASCQANDTSRGLILTSSSVPSAFTCFNLTDTFSQSNDTGFQNATQRIYDEHGDIIQPNGIDWLLQNGDMFDSKTNYSRVWYEQFNQTGKKEAGEPAPWVFYVYAFPDCQQVGGDDFDEDQYPWFETSCQTKVGGQCQTLPYSIKSFGIHSSVEYNARHGRCEAWAYKGAAARLSLRLLLLVAVSASVTTFILVP